MEDKRTFLIADALAVAFLIVTAVIVWRTSGPLTGSSWNQSAPIQTEGKSVIEKK
jgi:hypothetical protein